MAQDASTDLLAGAEPTQQQATTEAPAAEPAQKRVSDKMSLQDRFKVADFLRARVEPFVGETKTDIAKQVSEQCGVEISSGSLFYLAESLPDYKILEKLILKNPKSGEETALEAVAQLRAELLSRIAALEEKVKQLGG